MDRIITFQDQNNQIVLSTALHRECSGKIAIVTYVDIKPTHSREVREGIQTYKEDKDTRISNQNEKYANDAGGG